MDPILEQFLTEARENLEYLDQNLSDLKDGDEEIVNALFRAAHTLKGGAGLVGFNSVKEITHAAEDLLDAYRKKELEFSEEIVDVLYDAFDEVVELIDAAEELGSVEVEVDEEKILQIKNEIRSFLQKEENEQKIEIPFNVDETLAISNYFTFSQISKLSSIAPIKTPQITKEFLENSESLWLVEFDLDRDVLKLGNDPIYLFYLLGAENINAIGVEVEDCIAIKEDPHDWVSYIVASIKADASLIEETFYNIIEDLRFTPLSIEKLFDSSYEDATDISLLDEFKSEALNIYKSSDFSLFDEKLNAAVQILNPESKEGFILTALQAILPNFKIDSSEYKEIVKIAFSKLGWFEDGQIDEKIEIAKPKDEELKTQKNDDKAVANAINILNAQLKALELSNDEALLGRTKLLLSNVLGFLDLDDGVATTSTVEDLKVLIKEKIKILSGKDEEKSKPILKEEVNTQKEQISTKNKQSTQNKKTDKIKAPKTPSKDATPTSINISKTVKIEQSQIDELMDIVGELLVMKNALPYIAKQIVKGSAEHAKRELLSKYEQISRVTDRLQDRVMGMRLLPLSYIFGRYPKLVRDLSKKLGKKIKYIEEGGDTKLDKTVIEKLADPMIHIIRNSLDHGLESEEERLEAGKDATGILKISARSEGDKVFISIEDDGRGIDEQKIVMKALEMRLVDPEQIDSMSKEEKLKLLFAPGLSTKEEVTELSGRGVGTDAVKKIIEELGGNIYIESELGKGTKTTFELPLSVALTNIFHVKMNGVNYALSMDYVVETEKVETKEIKTATHKPFIRMRGELIPLLFEPVLLGRSKPDKDEVCLVVVQSQNQKFGLVVDEFVGQLDVVQKPLSGVFAEHPFITGTSLLGNGEVLFVLDPKKLIKG